MNPTTSLVHKFSAIVNEFSQIAIAGDGARHCLYRIQLIDCYYLAFYKEKKFSKFLNKFKTFTEQIFIMCGKDELRQHWQSKVDALIASSKAQCGGGNGAAPGGGNWGRLIDREEESDYEYSDSNNTDTTQITEAPETTQITLTTEIIPQILYTDDDGQCPTDEYFSSTTKVFNAVADTAVDPLSAQEMFKIISAVISGLGDNFLNRNRMQNVNM